MSPTFQAVVAAHRPKSRNRKRSLSATPAYRLPSVTLAERPPFETRKHNFYAMFGLLLRADQETAKRAIIFGGCNQEGKGRERARGKIRWEVADLRQKYSGMEEAHHHAPHTLSYPLSHRFFVEYACIDSA